MAETLNQRPAVKLQIRGIADRKEDTLALTRFTRRRRIRVETYRRMLRNQRPDRIDAVQVTGAE
ncbi:hypothetical protein TVNIR_1718 [Thioalkalivibrio nitratireducens DSM 14787]|uniref:Uncharacterized protein n=1 Tax=Thioalkalivibrio nitratireducens (strain DSM 14787 / UNIQEM 213 / ALEN2) TaxID=1255043 RepID=L0DWQ7_THIND|nr:hypothetical protein [Thioalkalivibrio nitratireducens]AGA33380.1 hypothetical protein TVNIR_1718 [Thioalkalivibrio nitratireducens DSM 14787]